MVAWPADLPQTVLAAGYEESPPDLVLRTAMDAGPAKVRRRFTAGPRLIPVSAIMTAAQVATLDAFFLESLAGGALAFDWIHPRTQAAASMRIMGPPRYANLAGDAVWEVSMTLEILP